MTTRDLAEMFDLDEGSVRTMAREGVLPAARISGRWVFDGQAVEILQSFIEEADDEPDEPDYVGHFAVSANPDEGAYDDDDYEEDDD